MPCSVARRVASVGRSASVVASAALRCSILSLLSTLYSLRYTIPYGSNSVLWSLVATANIIAANALHQLPRWWRRPCFCLWSVGFALLPPPVSLFSLVCFSRLSLLPFLSLSLSSSSLDARAVSRTHAFPGSPCKYASRSVYDYTRLTYAYANSTHTHVLRRVCVLRRGRTGWSGEERREPENSYVLLRACV